MDRKGVRQRGLMSALDVRTAKRRPLYTRDVADPVLDFLAPEMYWYGWTASAAIPALVIGLVAAFLPDSLCWFCVWCLCVVPPMAMIAFIYLTIPWLRL